MRKPFKIGKKEYKFKKDAIAHYRAILNSYDFEESLNESDHKDLIDLLNFDYINYLAENELIDEENVIVGELDNEDILENDFIIEDIKVAKVQFNTKCFEIVFKSGKSQYISYLMMINKSKFTPEMLFNKACRNSIQNDIRDVKQDYFDKNSKKGYVKCQETGMLSKWTELVVDHRQPHTFSIIIDRFKEVNKVDLDKIEYTSNNQNHIIFKDEELTEQFRKYHMEKASLRIVRKECNSSRTGLAKIKRTAKDLTIKDNPIIKQH